MKNTFNVLHRSKLEKNSLVLAVFFLYTITIKITNLIENKSSIAYQLYVKEVFALTNQRNIATGSHQARSNQIK